MNNNTATATTQDYQPRFIAYARACGNTPEAQLVADDSAWPGGCMTGFILWIGGKWNEWKSETQWGGIVLTNEDHTAFDNWLLTDTPVAGGTA